MPRRNQLLTVIYALAVASFTLITSCSKNDTVTPEEPPVAEDTTYYRVYRVENLYAPVDDANPTAAPPVFFFNLSTRKHVQADYAKTTDWDVAFGSLYNSILSGNNGLNSGNYGAGAAGIGGICILEKHFDEVTDIPAETAFSTQKDIVGLDAAGAFGTGTGWYMYDFGGTIAGDGSYEKQHVAYALGEGLTLSNGSELAPRTIVVRTAKGDFAKIKMISVYENAYTPDQWFRETPHMYFTFEYVLVPKGSTKFEIK
ncbi:HmuY family protein [Chitinophaga sp. XS-30]|uniref:HmuY family protein n=1 Tax=Chitinophaga sp. XS-30 TaxID=2604421 RepID=UPI00143DB5F4|nr:HmuY family protein [Chitinophaga sp. XS-30]